MIPTSIVSIAVVRCALRARIGERTIIGTADHAGGITSEN